MPYWIHYLTKEQFQICIRRRVFFTTKKNLSTYLPPSLSLSLSLFLSPFRSRQEAFSSRSWFEKLNRLRRYVSIYVDIYITLHSNFQTIIENTARSQKIFFGPCKLWCQCYVIEIHHVNDCNVVWWYTLIGNALSSTLICKQYNIHIMHEPATCVS